MAIHAIIRQANGAEEPVTLAAGMSIEQYAAAVAPAGIMVVRYWSDAAAPPADPYANQVQQEISGYPPNAPPGVAIPWWVWALGGYWLLRR